MPDQQQNDLTEYVRAVQARLVRHSLQHRQGTVDARTAMIILKNGLYKGDLPNPISADVLDALLDPLHPRRWHHTRGPFMVFRDAQGATGTIDLITAFLNPDHRVRCASLAELERQTTGERQFISPDTQRQVREVRADLLSHNVTRSVGASISCSDALDDDYFYHHEGLRQCTRLRLDEYAERFLERALTPNEQAICFLQKHPVFSPSSQAADIDCIIGQIADRVPSLEDLLAEYFRLFGHLALFGKGSAAGAVAAWRSRHPSPPDAWERLWKWADENKSPLATYHVCQVLCSVPEWVNAERHQKLWSSCMEVIKGPVTSGPWQLRCQLARYYCRHLEALAPETDGERVAVCAWWLAEYLATTLDAMPAVARKRCVRTIEARGKAVTQMCELGRPRVTASRLRYATLYDASLWATAIVCQISQSHVLENISKCGNVDERAAAAIRMSAALDLGAGSGQGAPVYANDGSALAFIDHLTRSGIDCASERPLTDESAAVGDGDALASLVSELPSLDVAQRARVLHALRRSAVVGKPPSEALWTALAKRTWRHSMLVEGAIPSIGVLCEAAIEVQLVDTSREWQGYLPHFIALAAEETPRGDERKGVLFKYTVAASLASDSVSAVVRLLKGDQRHDYDPYVAEWRRLIEETTPRVFPWIGAKLRGLKAVLHNG